MPLIEANVSCPVHSSFGVQQVAGMFDVPLAQRASESFRAEVPAPDEAWQIGLIVGPSGSGKSTIARTAFGGDVYQATAWLEDKAVVDGLGDLPIKTVTGLFTAVGFSSPPSWIKPYQVLSRGEQFRCDLARALAGALTATDDNDAHSAGRSAPLVVFDEFTSVVDRNVARIGSAAVAKGIRGGRIPCRFVAVTCHRDVAEWLQPDWTVDMETGACDWRRLRRPSIKVRIFRCQHDAWRAFARHHYLSGQLSRSARCYLGVWENEAVSFCATIPLIGQRNRWRITRIVTLPDYQGVGIGMRVAEAVADEHRRQGHRVNVTASHPALVAHCRNSENWRTVRVSKAGTRRATRLVANYRNAADRTVVSFEYVGGREESRELRVESPERLMAGCRSLAAESGR